MTAWGIRYQIADVSRAVEFYTKRRGFTLDHQQGAAFAKVSCGSTPLFEAGVAFRNEIEVGPGGSQIQIEDPDGNPIALFQPAASRA